MKYFIKIPSLLITLLFSSTSFSSDFYVFPVKEIEGLSIKKAAGIRPLVDPKSAALFTPDSQKQILNAFELKLADSYPGSIVNPYQVRDAIRGKYQYSQNTMGCGEGFVAPVNRSYAVVAGITRASYYQVDKGENVEILIPITLNIQLIKPEKAKIVYTASSTHYTPFVFSKRELNDPTSKSTITKALTNNTSAQLIELVDVIKKNFEPKETIVKIIDKSEGFIVVDKGFEVGFRTGDELEARLSKDKEGNPLIFKVMSVDSGFSILKPMAGIPTVGDDYLFIFEAPADDSRKPKLMTVTSDKPEFAWTNSVADLFAKDIGFKAPFQLISVDANFNDTMNSVRAQANCVPWDKYPSSKTIFDSRDDPPNFFLRFEKSESPVFTHSGAGGTRSEEKFMTLLTSQVVDKDGSVIFSESGKDSYLLEKVGGQGLSLSNAKEISLKNSLVDLMSNFLKSVKLEPKEFKIINADKGKFSVKGLEIPPGQDIVYEVLHPLGVKFQSKNVSLRLNVDRSTNLPVSLDGITTIYYSGMAPDYPPVENGDILRVINMPRGAAPEISACGSTYIGKDSIQSDHLTPLINSVAYKSVNYSVSISNGDFYSDVNRLLHSGFFKFRIPPYSKTEFCFKPGYVVKQTGVLCEGSSCKVSFLTGIKILIEKEKQDVKDIAIGDKSEAEGISENEITSFIGYQSMIRTDNLLQELTKRFNTK